VTALALVKDELAAPLSWLPPQAARAQADATSVNDVSRREVGIEDTDRLRLIFMWGNVQPILTW
jgi:hypothetical protein